jgi:hypothetical protein
VPAELVERMRADFLTGGDRGSALIVCSIAYTGLRTLSEISGLGLRDIGTNMLRVNAPQDAPDAHGRLAGAAGRDLRRWIADLPAGSINAQLVPRFDGNALLESDWRS